MRKTFSLPVAATAAGGGVTPPPADTVDNIEHSVRFNSADNAYLSRTPSSAGNRKTWTWSGWVKRSGLGNLQHIFQGAVGSTDVLTFLRFNADDTLRFGSYNAGYQFNLTPNAVFRDTSAWYHIVVYVDTTQSTSTDRVKIYVNGEETTSFSTSDYPSQNFEGYVNISDNHHIGRYNVNTTRNFDGYLANIHFVDGQALTPSSFGFTDSNGVWQPKAFSGSYGTNGFYLDFADTSSATALGNDVSGNNNDFTPSGLVAGPAYTANSWSTEFDGTGDYLTATSSEFAFGTGDYTIEAWVYVNSLTSTDAIVVTGTSSAATNWQLDVYSGSSGYLRFIYSGSSVLTGTVSLNTWHHVAATRSGTTVRLFVDGVQQSSATNSSNLTDTALKIGENRAGTAWFNGKISNLRIIKGRALYTAAFTPPSTALTATDDTVLLTCQDATVRDNSNIGHDVTASGDVAVVNEGPFNGYSGSFDGTGDYLSLSSNPDFAVGTGEYTIELWTYLTASSTAGVFFVVAGGLQFSTNNSNYISVAQQGVAWELESTTTVPLNQWVHLAATRDSSNTTRIFLNGSQIASGSITTNYPQGAAYVNYNPANTSSHHTGYYSNLRVIKGQALYTAAFTPPTADLTTTSQGATASNVKLLTCQNSTFIDNSPSAHTITANGDAHTVSVNPHTDKYSVTFDGTGDYLTAGSASDWTFLHNGSSFTAEWWFNTASTSTETLFSTSATQYNPGLSISLNNGATRNISARFYKGSLGYLGVASSASSWDVNTWNHVAVVYNSSTTTLTLYVNGVSADTADGSSFAFSSSDSSFTLAVGRYQYSPPGGYFNGKISNVRLTNGQALYTSNFLPSKEDLTTTSQGATASNVKLLTCQSYKIQDNSPSAHTITANGDAAPSTVAPFVTSGAGSFDGSGDYLSTPSSSDYNLGTGNFTVECLVNFNDITSNFGYVGLVNRHNFSPAAGWGLWLESGGLLSFSLDGYNTKVTDTASVNVNKWYHVAAVRNGSTVSLYVDGQLKASTTNSSFTDASTQLNIGIASASGEWNAAYPLNGEISNVRISKGLARYTAAFTPPTEDFDPTDQDTTFLALQGNTLDDLSGNDHAVTANGDAATSTVSPFEPVDGSDAMLDSPTNYGSGDTIRGNYCTLNPIDLLGSGVTLSEGNLKFVTTASAVHRRCRGTIFVSSGKWYAEATLNTVGGTYPNFGIITNTSNNSDTYIGGDSESYGYNSNGSKSNNGSGTAYGATYTTGDTIGAALDLDAGTVVFYKNGVSQGTAYSSLSGLFTFGISGFGSSATWTLNFGQQPFKYPVAGYKSLCSTNLPTPAVADGSTAMDVALYTGTGTAQSISTPNLSPDLVWLKIRNTAGSHGLWDSVRGTSSRLVSNTTGSEDTTVGVTALSSNGFTVDGPYNTAPNNWAAWAWDAGSSTVSNTDGTLTSSVRANPTAGVSIATWTSASSSTTNSFGHGLAKTPEFIVMKSRNNIGNNSNWLTYHSALGATKYLRLNTTGGATTTNIWVSGPSSSVVNIEAGAWQPGDWITFAFAPVEGFSAFGSYVGDGSSSNGPFVYTGMRPKWIMIKDTTGSTNHWVIYDTERDTYNESGKRLAANLADQEGASGTLGSGIGGIDILSNGFKIDIAGGNHNTLNSTYIYAAFAEHPFKTSRAR